MQFRESKREKRAKKRNETVQRRRADEALYIINFGLGHNCVNQTQIRLKRGTPPFGQTTTHVHNQAVFFFFHSLFKDWPRAQHTRNREAAQEETWPNIPVSA